LLIARIGRLLQEQPDKNEPEAGDERAGKKIEQAVGDQDEGEGLAE